MKIIFAKNIYMRWVVVGYWVWVFNLLGIWVWVINLLGIWFWVLVWVFSKYQKVWEI